MPRKMELESLVSLLTAEHVQIKNGLAQLRIAVSTRDFAKASALLQELDRVFRQHIADEEAQVLRVLIAAYGVQGAEDEIRVFRQHRPIYALMEKVKGLASLRPEELASDQTKLAELFEEHASAEENRVFPRALLAHGGSANKGDH